MVLSLSSSWSRTRSYLQANPVHSLVTALLAFGFLSSYHANAPYQPISRATFSSLTKTGSSSGTSQNGGAELSLAQRLERSEDLFQTSRSRRSELTKKFGNDPDSYPYTTSEKGPWPAMTWWDYVYPAFNCPHEFERIGATGDGGKWVCGLSRIARKPDCVIYSFGINLESSFEAEMLKRSECQVWGYDFSVPSFGPEITRALTSRSHFYKYGLAGHDAPLGDPPMYRLSTLMKVNGHAFIDVLKIDIETYEFEVLTDLLKEYKGRPLPFGQLLLEIHAWSDRFPKAMDLVNCFGTLEEAGLRPFMMEVNMVYINYARDHPPELSEYSFINVKGNHALISD